MKVNAVVIKGINDHEIESLAEFAAGESLSLRFIESGKQAASPRIGGFIESLSGWRWGVYPSTTLGAGLGFHRAGRSSPICVMFIAGNR